MPRPVPPEGFHTSEEAVALGRCGCVTWIAGKWKGRTCLRYPNHNDHDARGPMPEVHSMAEAFNNALGGEFFSE